MENWWWEAGVEKEMIRGVRGWALYERGARQRSGGARMCGAAGRAAGERAAGSTKRGGTFFL